MAAAGRVIAIAAMLAAAGCQASDEKDPDPRPSRRAKRGYEAEIAERAQRLAKQLEGVTGATVVRLREGSERDQEQFVVFGEAVALDGEQLAMLRMWVSKLEGWPDKKCEFMPGIRIDLGTPDKIDVCFSCGEVRGAGVGLMGEEARPRAIAWAKALFPDDPEIQALGEKKR